VLDGLAGEPRLAGGHRLAAVRAHLLEMDGRPDEARSWYRRAAAAATSLPEREYLLARANRLRSGAPDAAGRPGERQGGPESATQTEVE